MRQGCASEGHPEAVGKGGMPPVQQGSLEKQLALLAAREVEVTPEIVSVTLG